MKLNILFVTHNRLLFTQQSWFSLQKNTNWSLVNKLIVYEDGSVDGTREFIQSQLLEFKGSADIIFSNLQSPVAIMNSYIQRYDAPYFVKVDNDVIVPPLWLDKCVEVMSSSVHLDLLGIEPAWSRTQSPWSGNSQAVVDPNEIVFGHMRAIPCTAIGGIGMMRRECFFDSGLPRPHSIYGGFTDWQWQNKKLIKGWIAPSLKLFLLDRMPMAPWKDLSVQYIFKKWQRPWTDYSPDIAHLWNWWEPNLTPQLQTYLNQLKMAPSVAS